MIKGSEDTFMIYLDNAATSWPKPPMVADRVREAILHQGGNPGRSGHAMSLAAGKLLEEARNKLAHLFNVADPHRIVFALNATDALHLAINGSLEEGGHVIISSMEHNAVTRPLHRYQERGGCVTKIPMDPVSGVDPENVKKALRKDTRLVVMTHASNVCGTVNPIKEIGLVCREAGVPLLVDASQSAGCLPVDVEAMNIDMLAFPGHKSLLGPTGTGGLYIREGVEMAPVRLGGTGLHSEEQDQPREMPFRYESGTQNVQGLAGLAAGLDYIEEEGLDAIESKEESLTSLLLEGLAPIEGLSLYGPPKGVRRAPVVSFTLENVDPIEIAAILDQSFAIAVRAGLHCAPDAHGTIGTLAAGGTVRVSPGPYNTEEDIQRVVDAIGEIAEAF